MKLFIILLTAYSVTLVWHQTERTCLYYQAPQHQAVPLECYPQVNTQMRITIGAVGPLDGHYRVQEGGIYTLRSDSGKVATATILWSKFLPIMLKPP